MVIQGRLIAKGDPYSTDISALNAASELTAEAGSRVLQRIQPEAQAELRALITSAPSQHKGRWSNNAAKNARACAWWFWALKQGIVSGARTGFIASMMFFDGKITERGYEFVTGNRSSKAKYVVGTMDESREYRNPGHLATGHQPIKPTADFWLEAADEEMEKELDSVYIEYTSKRQNR